MTINRTVFREAAAQHLAPYVADRLDAAWATATPSPTDGEADAGRALAIATSSLPPEIAAPQIDRLHLASVEFLTSDSLTLTPRDAFSHPLLGEWAAATFADSLADCIRSGRIGAHYAPNAPIYSLFELVEEAGEIGWAATTIILASRAGEISVRLNYGHKAGCQFGRISSSSGNGVFALGVELRGTSPLAEDGDEEPAPPGPSPLSPQLH